VAGTHVAFLRGVNVGGKNRMAMAELVTLFETAGCKDVRHYIQSGNVLFKASPALAKRLPERIGQAIVERFGFAAPVQVRSLAQLSAAIAINPFAGSARAERELFVVCLAREPAAADVSLLDAARSAPDRFAVVGAEIFLHLQGSAATTKLTNAYFDSRLKTVSTARNWQTVNTLVKLLQES
jgi:uncharacterized protein (DUF1697 family)